MTIFADRKAGTGIRSGLWTYSRTNTYLYQYDMLKNLVIVESPAKAKTIEKFLGNDYKVMSSYGHIRDLKNIVSASMSTMVLSPSTKSRMTRSIS